MDSFRVVILAAVGVASLAAELDGDVAVAAVVAFAGDAGVVSVLTYGKDVLEPFDCELEPLEAIESEVVGLTPFDALFDPAWVTAIEGVLVDALGFEETRSDAELALELFWESPTPVLIDAAGLLEAGELDVTDVAGDPETDGATEVVLPTALEFELTEVAGDLPAVGGASEVEETALVWFVAGD